jgi:hypothetical protein
VTLWGSLKSTRLALWDENTQKLVSFRQAARACGCSPDRAMLTASQR